MRKQISAKALKIIKISVTAFILAVIALLWAGTLIAYNENFNQRFTSYEPKMLYLSDFEGLKRTQYHFTSNKNQKLTGYLYSSEKSAAGRDTSAAKGLVIFAHGFGGGGHNSYMDCINFFAEKGYLVFAYDATGNDESEGLGRKNAVGGLPQGVIDLDYAISFVEKSGNFPDLPIYLWGHSWGGYSVVNVLNYHPEVKAVAEIAGFESSGKMFIAGGKQMAGSTIYSFMPFFYLHEFRKYGKYNFSTGVKGIKKSNARVMIIHGKQDTTVPLEYGYSVYYKSFKNNPRVRFLFYENLGHSNILRSQKGNDYIKAFNAEFDKWLTTLDYDYKAKENVERFVKDKSDYLHKNLNRPLYCNTPNEEMLEKILVFYEENEK